MKNVKVYSTPTCPYCKIVKKFLAENNVHFEDIDISSSRTGAQEMIDRSGQMAVPVIDIDGALIIGFDKSAIKSALGF